MNTYKTQWDGYDLFCVYEYEPPLPADDINPAWEGFVTICEVYINNSTNDALNLLDPALIQNLEALILEALQ
jgi:hypothetical protein